MRLADRRLWRRIPGYDSDAEDEDEEEQQQEDPEEVEEAEDGEAEDGEAKRRQARAGAEPPLEETLESVLAALGGRWTDADLVTFRPPPGGKAGAVAAPPASKWTGGSDGVMPTFRIEKISAPLVRDTLLFNGLRPTAGPGFLVQWSGPRMNQNLYSELHEFQRVNHFPGSEAISQKDRLWTHFNRMAKTMEGAFDFVPESFVLPAQTEEFKQKYKKNSDDIWIVKPHASSQGKGIYLLKNLDDLPQRELSVVCKYVHNPLLIQGLKFDLRIYVLVTSFDPLRAYIYREGLTRFASKPYSTEDEHLGDSYRHLTNYSINKKAENFRENQNVESDNYGHKWSLSALNRHLECVGVDVDLMWNRIMDLIVKTLLSVQPAISAKVAEAKVLPQCCFELYGFDVLVDEDLKPWLLEVNLSPSMAAESPLDKQVKSSVLSDTFNLIGLRRVNARTCTEARLYSQLVNMRLDPRRLSQAGVRRAAPPEGRRVEASELLLDLPSALERLGERELKMLAHSLEEQQRCNNFIRLYPTRQAVEYYAPIMRMLHPGEAYRARLLAAALCGVVAQRPGSRAGARDDAPARPASPGSSSSRGSPTGNSPQSRGQSRTSSRAGSRAGTASGRVGRRRHTSAAEGSLEAAKEDLRRRAGSAVDRGQEAPQEVIDEATRSVPEFYDATGAEVALQVLKVLGTKMRSHLVLMEYLVRVASLADGLQEAEWERLDEQGVVAMLRSFRQRLVLFLRTEARLSKMEAARAVVRGSADSDSDALALACRGALSCLAADAWAGGAPALAALGGGGAAATSLVECLPTAFAHTASGQRAIVALLGLSAEDLEFVLQGPQAISEVRALLGGDEQWQAGDEPSAGAVRHRLRTSRGLPCGPLSGMLSAVPQRVLPPLRPVSRPLTKSQSMPSMSMFAEGASKGWSGGLLAGKQGPEKLLKRKPGLASVGQMQLVPALPQLASSALSTRDIEL